MPEEKPHINEEQYEGKLEKHKNHPIEEIIEQHKEERDFEETGKKKIKGYKRSRMKHDSHFNKAKTLRSHRSIRGRRGT
ncbi:hypothetical protein JXI42_10155 [bacterium]|nr:hypothetical protein [bacterium]